MFLLQLFSLILNGCNETVKDEPKGNPDTASTTTASSPTTKELQSANLEEYAELFPLELKDSSNSDVYRKYGIEFSGNCYACDLAKIKIDEKQMDLVNICNDSDFYRIEGFTFSKMNDMLKITTAQNEFQLTKIENAPVYKLEFNGNKLNLKGKRLSIFFTPKKEIPKFKEYDCGDFEG